MITEAVGGVVSGGVCVFRDSGLSVIKSISDGIEYARWARGVDASHKLCSSKPPGAGLMTCAATRLFD